MFLIDTHILIWAISEPEKLKQHEVSLLEDTSKQIIVSVASIWECAIKKGLGKLTLPDRFEMMVKKTGFQILSIDSGAAWRVKDLPFHHADPFDRLLIAAAQEHQFTIVTHDAIFKQYDVNLF